MSHQLMKAAEAACLKANVPEFAVGNTVDVHCKIVEGSRERVQIFTGVVIARRGSGINQAFKVRRIVNQEGVERTFMLHSPRVLDVKVKRVGKTRRAKLYFLRDRVGKAVRLREVRVRSTKKKGPSTVPASSDASAPAEPVGAAAQD